MHLTDTKSIAARNQAQLYIVNSNGAARQQVTSLSDLRGRSDWAVSGLIAFYAGVSWKRNIFLMSADGSAVTQITNGGNSQAPQLLARWELDSFYGLLR